MNFISSEGRGMVNLGRCDRIYTSEAMGYYSIVFVMGGLSPYSWNYNTEEERDMDYSLIPNISEKLIGER